MGYIKHHAIVLTSWKYEHLEAARAKAEELGLRPTELTNEVTNGYRSFMVPPDGSKEGWEESEGGEQRRQTFRGWLYAQSEDLYVEWCEVAYGSDDCNAAVTTHAWDEAQGTIAAPKAVRSTEPATGPVAASDAPQSTTSHTEEA